MRILAALALCWMLSVAALAGPAPSPAPERSPEAPVADADVRAALEKEKLKFEVDDRANYRLEFQTSTTGRSQLVLIGSSVDKYEKYAMRDVWSVSWSGPGPLKPEIADQLLQENGKVKVGAWETTAGTDKVYVIFNAKVAADLSPENLRSVLELVAEVADQKEMVLGDKTSDKF